MSNSLGSMVLQLSANTATFQSDMGKAAQIAAANAAAMQKAVQGAVDSITGSLGNIAGKLVAAFSVDKLTEFGAQAIETADQIGKMAQKVGVSVESLSALSVQAKLSGSGIDDLGGGMEKLAKNAAAAASGSKEQAAAFSAIGVSVKDATGNLRPMQQILGDVAAKFSGYADSASKTALAQELFGKSGANLIPVLNDLGDKGFGELTKQAEQFGAVISGDTAKRAEEFEDNLSKLGIEAKGFATAVASQLLPSLDKLTSGMVDAGKTTDNYASSAETVANGIKVLIASLLTAKEIISGVATSVFAFFDAVNTVFQASGKVVQAWAEDTYAAVKASLSFDTIGLAQADADFKSRIASIGKDVVTSFAGVTAGLKGGVGDAVSNAQTAWTALFGAIDKTGKAADSTSDSLRKGTAPLVANAAAADAAAKAAEKLAQDYLSAQKFLDGLAQNVGGPYQKSWEQYAGAIDAARKAANQYSTDGMKAADVQKFLADATQLATQRFQEQTDAQTQITKYVDDVNEKYAEQNRLLGLTGVALQVEIEYQRLKTESDKAMLNVMGPLTEAQQAQIDSLHGMAAAHVQLAEDTKLSQEAAKGWQSIWSNAADSVADTFAKVVVEGGSLFDSLKNLAKQTVEQIIAYFLRLQIINPILNSIFGGAAGFSLLPSAASAATSAGGGGAGGAGGIASLFSPSSWISAGQNLFSGFSSLFGSNPAAMGPPTASGALTSYAPGYSSTLQQGLGIAGGVYAGYSAYKGAGGGAGGLAAGAAYGAGTYFAGAAVSAALSGGIAAGLAAIPVVGWIAIAAMAVNSISGGKLFGTAWQTKSSTLSLGIGPDGGTATATLQQQKQGALFSGTKNQNKNVAAGADAQAAAQSLFDSVKAVMVSAAHQLTIDVPPVIQAALNVVNTYDKKGNVTATKYVVDILGKQYTEASQELAATRIAAEAIVATVAASEAGKAASTIAEQWRSSADTLMDGANFLLAATTDLTKGINLLGDGGTLTDIAAVVTELQQAGESLVTTYQRLGAETTTIQQQFDLAGVSMTQSGKAAVEFADGVAQAAGGLDKLTALVQQFDQAYFSAADIAKQNAATLKKSSDTALTGIGEDPNESMAQFKADFLKKLPTLTPEELANWYAAGVALASYTAAVTDSANQIAAAKQNYAAFEYKLFGDNFLSAFSGAVQAEQQQIDQANALAKAAGLAGASQEDLTAIMTQGSYAIGQALAQLTAGIQSDITAIYGVKDSTSVTTYMGAIIPGAASASANAAAQQQQAQNASSAYDLIQKLGDFAFASGKSMADVLKQFGITPDQLAKTLGETPDAVAKQLKAATGQAASLTTMAAQGAEQIGLQQDILAAIRGQPLPYDLSALVAPSATRNSVDAHLPPGSNPLSGRGLGAPVQASSPDVVAAILQTHGEKMASDKKVIASNNMLRAAIYNRNGRAQTA